MRQTWPSKHEDAIREFVDAILHGSNKHKTWLVRAGEEFIFTGKVTITDD